MSKENILIPVDFSDVSNNALEYGVAFAESIGADVTLFHSVSYPGADPLAPAYDHSATVAQSELINQREDVARTNMQNQVDQLKKRDSMKGSIDFVIAVGFPVDEIIRVTDENDYSFVVMGTKGESNFEDTILGSITSNVIRKSNHPVLAVPEGTTFNGISNVAFATNYDEGDKDAIHKLLDITQNFSNAQITALHVRPEDENDEQNAKQLQEMITNENYGERVKLDSIESQDVEKGINQYIEQQNVDMVAMLMRNMGFIRRMFDPSLTKKMAFHTNVPLLVFHHE